MTEQEAIKDIQRQLSEINSEDADITLSTESLRLAIKALEKQIPKKPKKSGVTDSKGVFHATNGINGVPYDLCPNCEINLCTDGMFGGNKNGMKYCKNCGQKLDWE